MSWLADVERRIPTVVFGARDAAGRDVFEVRVLLDGQPIAERLDGMPVPIDPGAHMLRFEPKEGAAVSLRVLVRESEHDRLIDVRLGARSEEGATPAAPAAAPAPEDRTRSIPVVSYALAGVAVAAAGGWAFFGATGKSDVDHLRATCEPRCAPSDVDSARREILLANVSFGVAAVALGAALVTWLAR
jgi:hypothetical protein